MGVCINVVFTYNFYDRIYGAPKIQKHIMYIGLCVLICCFSGKSTKKLTQQFYDLKARCIFTHVLSTFILCAISNISLISTVIDMFIV